MDGIDIGLTALRILVKLVSSPKLPKIDYGELCSTYND